MARRVTSQEVIQALADAGVIAEPEKVRRLVIDLQDGRIPALYVESSGDARLLDVALGVHGIEVQGMPPGGAPAGMETKSVPGR